MRRSIFAIVSALSLLMCAWGIVAWVRSYDPRASATPRTLSMQIGLARRLPALQFDQVGFSDVIDFLRDVSGANVRVDWRSLESIGVDRNAPVTASLRNIRFGEAIARIVSQVGDVSFIADERFVAVGPKGRISLHQIERLPAAPGAADLAMRRTLGRRALLGGPATDGLRHVIQSLSQQTGVPILCDWDELERARVEQDTRSRFSIMPAFSFDAAARRSIRGWSECRCGHWSFS